MQVLQRELSTATQHERPDADPARVTRTPTQLSVTAMNETHSRLDIQG